MRVFPRLLIPTAAILRLSYRTPRHEWAFAYAAERNAGAETIAIPIEVMHGARATLHLYKEVGACHRRDV